MSCKWESGRDFDAALSAQVTRPTSSPASKVLMCFIDKSIDIFLAVIAVALDYAFPEQEFQ